jgi:hypothetical protein
MVERYRSGWEGDFPAIQCSRSKLPTPEKPHEPSKATSQPRDRLSHVAALAVYHAGLQTKNYVPPHVLDLSHWRVSVRTAILSWLGMSFQRLAFT